MPVKGKHSHLLKDPDVRRWHDNLAAGSEITAGVYLRGLGLFCEHAKTTPQRILKEADSKGFRDGFIDFIRRLESEGKAGSYIERFSKVVLSWTAYNGVNVKLKVNIKGRNDSPTLANERVPTRDEL
ncbi:MAG TPA: hypothetical protein VGR56_06375 [Nitrososphaerales archaeon]|nr:hypothetical protein [Nitrososphaerales archaeon]